MTHKFGTSWFATERSAQRYYGRIGYSGAHVAAMVEEGAIHIGKPPLKADETAELDRDGRWTITVQDLPAMTADMLPIDTEYENRPPVSSSGT